MGSADSKTEQRGIVLIIVVMMIAILSTIVIDFMYSTRVNYEISFNSSIDVQARHIAKSGVRVVRGVLRKKALEEIPVFKGFLGQSIKSQNGSEGWNLSISSFPVQIGNISLEVIDERSRVNLNALVSQKSNRVDFQVRTQLNELFRFLEVETEKADLFVASLVNWLDGGLQSAGNDQDPDGSTADYYARLENPYYIKDGPLDSVEEIRMIHGMDKDFFFKVKDYLTVYPQDKKVSFSTASKTVIMATIKAAEVSVNDRGSDSQRLKDSVVERMADEIITHRRTKMVISVSEVKKVLKGVDSSLKISSGLSGVILKDGKSDVYRVFSTGIVGENVPVMRQIQAVLHKNLRRKNSYPKVVSWKER